MSVPKKRLSKRRTRARRSHHGVTVPAAAPCSSTPGCKGIVRHHYACPVCGKRKTRATAKKAAPAAAAKKAPAKKPAATKAPAKKKAAPAKKASTKTTKK